MRLAIGTPRERIYRVPSALLPLNDANTHRIMYRGERRLIVLFRGRHTALASVAGYIFVNNLILLIVAFHPFH